MSAAPRRWELRLSGQLMATLIFAGYETPWIDVDVQAEPAMDAFRRYFEDSSTWPDDDPALEAMLEEVRRRGGFTVTPEGLPPTCEFSLVNVDGKMANLRL